MNRLDDISAAFRTLRAGSTICVHTGCSEPLVLTRHLAERASELDGVNVLTLMPMGDSPYGEENPARHLVNRSFFPGKGMRKAFAKGFVEPLHHRLSEIPGVVRSGRVQYGSERYWNRRLGQAALADGAPPLEFVQGISSGKQLATEH